MDFFFFFFTAHAFIFISLAFFFFFSCLTAERVSFYVREKSSSKLKVELKMLRNRMRVVFSFMMFMIYQNIQIITEVGCTP